MSLRAVLCLLALLALAACDSGDPADLPTPPSGDEIVAGVNLTDLLDARPTSEERTAVAAEWAARAATVEPVAFRVESETAQEGATVRVVSFGVAGLDPALAEAGSFFGALRIPDRPPGEPGNPPLVVVFPEQADDAASLDDFLTDGPYAPLGEAFVQVLIALPGAQLQVGGTTYASRVLPETLPAFLDYEIDLARALLLAALPEADAERLGAVGFGIGAARALLLAERPVSPLYPFALRAVADLAGFTDFRAPSFRDVVRRVLRDEPTAFPGADALAALVLVPLRERILPLEDARRALLLRSPVYFAAGLPQVFIRHGEVDIVIGDDHSARLIGEVRARANFEILPDAGHEEVFADFGVQQALARFLQETVADEP